MKSRFQRPCTVFPTGLDTWVNVGYEDIGPAWHLVGSRMEALKTAFSHFSVSSLSASNFLLIHLPFRTCPVSEPQIPLPRPLLTPFPTQVSLFAETLALAPHQGCLATSEHLPQTQDKRRHLQEASMPLNAHGAQPCLPCQRGPLCAVSVGSLVHSPSLTSSSVGTEAIFTFGFPLSGIVPGP